MSDSPRPLPDRLRHACAASCTCMTKTPDLNYHDEMCRYRLYNESLQVIERLTARVAALMTVLDVRGEITTDGPPSMSIYLVTAYRWGNTNEHQYQVYCGPDRTKAAALARKEVEERGGKYDCAVYEFDSDGTDYKLIGYVPAYDATEPRHNWRLDMFERLGHFMNDWFDGQVMLLNPDKPGTLHYVKVDVPDLVKLEVARAREWCQTYEAMDAKRRAAREHADVDPNHGTDAPGS